MSSPAEPERYIHPTAEVEGASVGTGTRVWHGVLVMPGASVGSRCTLAKGAFVDRDVRIGDRVKLGNYASVYGGIVEDEAFIGPYAALIQDAAPRSTNPDGSRKESGDYAASPPTVRQGASIGAHAVVMPGVVIGRHAMVAAGSVVNRDVGSHVLVGGNPARPLGFVCRCGGRLDEAFACERCGRRHREASDGLEEVSSA
jgi:UDP-2-acetamido-3-amino-2,3-dideoxy-glucuronate N-acetyltransferase